MSGYLAPADVARRLACSTDTVLRAIHSGDLPAVKYGRLVRINADDVDRFIRSHQTAGTSRRHNPKKAAR